MGWPVITTSAKPHRIARVAEMIGDVWRQRHSYDIAHVEVYSGAAFFWAELVCELLRLMGKPFVLTLHGGNLPVFAERRPRRIRRLIESAFAVTTPSGFLYERMSRYRSDLTLVPNPIDLSSYHFTPRTTPKPRLIWLRSFHKIYNPTLAPRVVARLIEEFPDTQLTMIGPDKGDDSFNQTKNLAADLGVGHHIHFPGPIPKREISSWLARHDIFLNTTNVDNAPVSVIEAMAGGLCVVNTNVGGIPYLLEHQRDALLVPANDAEQMAAAVRQILTDRELSARLSHQARAKAEQYDWPTIMPQWERLLIDAARTFKK